MPDIQKCPKCGAPVNIKNPDMAKMYHCSYCDTSINLNSGESSTNDNFSFKPVPPKSALRLECEGSINGVIYQVIGRIRYQDTKDLSWWDEWLLLSQNGQYLWLTEENWEFVLMHKFTPKVPFDPNNVSETMEIDGYRLEVEDRSQVRLQFFEGELTWKAETGETVNYVDAWKGEDTLYSCEWTDREIMYFIGKEIPASDIYRAFNLGDPPIEAEREEDLYPENKFQQLMTKLMEGPLYKLTSIFGIIFAITALILGFIGTKVPNTSGESPLWEGQNIKLGQYNLSMPERVYKIDTTVEGINNQALTVEYSLVNEKNESLLSFEGDYWHASGTDGGENWSEKKNTQDFSFVLKDKGNYTLQAKAENLPAGLTPKIAITVSEGLFDTVPLWTLTLALLVYPGLILLLWLLAHSFGVPSEEED